MRVVYFGGQCLLLETQRKRILINPGRKGRGQESWFPRDQWKDIDLLIATYDDPAYAGFVEEIARRTKAQVLCQMELAQRLRLQKKGYLVGVIEPEKAKVLGGLKIEGRIPEGGRAPGPPPLSVLVKGPKALREYKRDVGAGPVANIGFLFEIDRIKVGFLGGAHDSALWGREEPALFFAAAGGPGVRFDRAKVLAVIERIAPTHVFTYGYESTLGARIFRRGEMEGFSESVKALRAIHHDLQPGKDFIYR